MEGSRKRHAGRLTPAALVDLRAEHAELVAPARERRACAAAPALEVSEEKLIACLAAAFMPIVYERRSVSSFTTSFSSSGNGVYLPSTKSRPRRSGKEKVGVLGPAGVRLGC